MSLLARDGEERSERGARRMRVSNRAGRRRLQTIRPRGLAAPLETAFGLLGNAAFTFVQGCVELNPNALAAKENSFFGKMRSGL
jgi:hypothetical protein